MEQARVSWWVLTLGAPALSGLLMAAAFPPLPLGFLAFASLLPLVVCAEQLQGRAAFGAGFVQGLAFYGATLYWIAWITPPGMAGAILYMALWRGLFVWLWGFSLRRQHRFGMWITPFLWVGIEYLSSLGDLGFPWMLLGHSQVDYLPLIQYAEATGVYGVSFWVVLVNLGLLGLVRSKQRAAMAGLLGLCFALPLAFGLWRLGEPAAEGALPVAIVQQNVPPVEKSHWGFDHNFDALKPMTIEASAKGARLVVWSEAALPAYFNSGVHQAYQARVQALVDSLNVFLYMGANRFEPGARDRRYNSSFLFRPGGGLPAHYDKVKVVPFGERAPFPGLLPFLRDFHWSGAGFVSGDFEAGADWTVFDISGGKFSGLICFDSAFPWLARKMAASGAEFLVVITNDGWFGRTPGPFQHAEMAVFRAIETRRPVVRCANTGVSMFVDAHGRRSQKTGIFHEALLYAKIAPRTDVSLYVLLGDVFAQLCLVLALMGLSVAAIRRPVSTDLVPKPAAGAVPAAASADLPDGGKPMPFLDHLEELRWHLLKGLAAVVIGAIFCGVFANEILQVLTRPIRLMDTPPLLQTLKPMGMFLVKLEIALIGGAVLALPFLIYHLWQFVAPGLFSSERRFVTFVIGSSTVCFAVGAVLAYVLVIPLAMVFFVGTTTDTGVVAQFDIGMYIGFVLRLLVAFGVVFELPVLTFFLAKMGIATADRMRKGRRYAILIGFIIAAILTPPDPISQVLMAIPMVLLYEVSIWVARIANR